MKLAGYLLLFIALHRCREHSAIASVPCDVQMWYLNMQVANNIPETLSDEQEKVKTLIETIIKYGGGQATFDCDILKSYEQLFLGEEEPRSDNDSADDTNQNGAKAVTEAPPSDNVIPIPEHSDSDTVEIEEISIKQDLTTPNRTETRRGNISSSSKYKLCMRCGIRNVSHAFCYIFFNNKSASTQFGLDSRRTKQTTIGDLENENSMEDKNTKQTTAETKTNKIEKQIIHKNEDKSKSTTTDKTEKPKIPKQPGTNKLKVNKQLTDDKKSLEKKSSGSDPAETNIQDGVKYQDGDIKKADGLKQNVDTKQSGNNKHEKDSMKTTQKTVSKQSSSKPKKQTKGKTVEKTNDYENPKDLIKTNRTETRQRGNISGSSRYKLCMRCGIRNVSLAFCNIFFNNKSASTQYGVDSRKTEQTSIDMDWVATCETLVCRIIPNNTSYSACYYIFSANTSETFRNIGEKEHQINPSPKFSIKRCMERSQSNSNSSYPFCYYFFFKSTYKMEAGKLKHHPHVMFQFEWICKGVCFAHLNENSSFSLCYYFNGERSNSDATGGKREDYKTLCLGLCAKGIQENTSFAYCYYFAGFRTLGKQAGINMIGVNILQRCGGFCEKKMPSKISFHLCYLFFHRSNLTNSTLKESAGNILSRCMTCLSANVSIAACSFINLLIQGSNSSERDTSLRRIELPCFQCNKANTSSLICYLFLSNGALLNFAGDTKEKTNALSVVAACDMCGRRPKRRSRLQCYFISLLNFKPKNTARLTTLKKVEPITKLIRRKCTVHQTNNTSSSVLCYYADIWHKSCSITEGLEKETTENTILDNQRQVNKTDNDTLDHVNKSETNVSADANSIFKDDQETLPKTKQEGLEIQQEEELQQQQNQKKRQQQQPEPTEVQSNYDVEHLQKNNELLKQKNMEYANKMAALETQVVRLENLILQKHLHKETDASAMMKLENQILKLEKELIKVSHEYHTMKRENDKLVNQQTQLTVRQDKTNTEHQNEVQILNNYQTRLNELTDHVKKQTNEMVMLSAKTSLLQQHNVVLQQMVLNQSQVISSLTAQVEDIIQRRIREEMEKVMQETLERGLVVRQSETRREQPPTVVTNSASDGQREITDPKTTTKTKEAKATQAGPVKREERLSDNIDLPKVGDAKNAVSLESKNNNVKPPKDRMEKRKENESANVGLPKMSDKNGNRKDKNEKQNTKAPVMDKETISDNIASPKVGNKRDTASGESETNKVTTQTDVQEKRIEASLDNMDLPEVNSKITPNAKIDKSKNENSKDNHAKQKQKAPNKGKKSPEKAPTSAGTKTNKIEKQIKQKNENKARTTTKDNNEKHKEPIQKDTNKLKAGKQSIDNKKSSEKQTTGSDSAETKMQDGVKYQDGDIKNADGLKQDVNAKQSDNNKNEKNDMANAQKTGSKQGKKQKSSSKPKKPTKGKAVAKAIFPDVPLYYKDDYEKPKDCYDHIKNGRRRDTTYEIHLHNGKSIKVFCDMKNGGWTVIQRRIDGKTDFARSWDEYKDGFGGTLSDHWLGNDNIHYITNSDDYILRVELTTWDRVTAYAQYSRFRIEDEMGTYKMHIEGYEGDAGDALSKHNLEKFSTYDRDNDKAETQFDGSCAKRFSGGWWYFNCYKANLNGKYYKNGVVEDGRYDGISWKTLKPPTYSFKKVLLKLIPRKSRDNVS